MVVSTAAASQVLGRPLAPGSAATARHPPTPELLLFPCRQVSRPGATECLSVLNVTVTPELLETGAECVASKLPEQKHHHHFPGAGVGRVLQRGGVGLIPIPPLTPIPSMSSTPDSNRTTNLSTSPPSAPLQVLGTSAGELGWTGHPHSALPSPGALDSCLPSISPGLGRAVM